jgi:hypothetical protein
MVALALDGAYELAVLCSADTDLIPAVELVRRRIDHIVVECIGWAPKPGHEAPEPLDIPGGGVIRRTIDAREFEQVADRTNFVVVNSGGPAPGQSGRRLPPNRRVR